MRNAFPGLSTVDCTTSFKRSQVLRKVDAQRRFMDVSKSAAERPETPGVTMATKNTRESWLRKAIEIFRPRFEEIGMPLPPNVHVSVGFSLGARAENGKILGSCFKRELSADGVNHIFISPESGDTAEVL